MELQGTLSRDSLEEDSKDSGKTLWTLIKDFCDYTSAHGFGRIKASKNWFLTLFWSMLFVGAVTIMTIQLHSLYKKYKSRPLTTLIEVETSTVSSRVSFPENFILVFRVRESFSYVSGLSSSLNILYEIIIITFFFFFFLFLHKICSQSLPFPTVTFCNFNPIRNKSLRTMIENGKMQHFIQFLSYGKSVLYLS